MGRKRRLGARLVEHDPGGADADNQRTGDVPPGADDARYRLASALQRLDGSRALVTEIAEGRIPPLVLRAVERCLTREDEVDLTRLRAGLDRLTGRR